MYSQVTQILSKHFSLSQCVWSRTRKASLTCSPHFPVLLLDILCSATRNISLPADAIAEMCATSSPSVSHCKTIILNIPHLPELFIPAILTCVFIQAMFPNKVVTVFTHPLFSVYFLTPGTSSILLNIFVMKNISIPVTWAQWIKRSK